SRAAVTNLLRLLALPEDVKTLLEKGEIEMGHARALLTLSEIQQVDATQQIRLKNLSVRDTEELVRRLQAPKIHMQSRPVDPDVQRLQNDLSQQIKLPVMIRYNAKGKGKIEIRYRNMV